MAEGTEDKGWGPALDGSFVSPAEPKDSAMQAQSILGHHLPASAPSPRGVGGH